MTDCPFEHLAYGDCEVKEINYGPCNSELSAHIWYEHLSCEVDHRIADKIAELAENQRQ